MKRQDLTRLVRQGEGLSLEFKRSTGELRQALETLCAFLNTKGGRILIGVGPRGEISGQQISDQTLHEVTQGFERFEPPASPVIERIPLARGQEVLSLSVEPNHEAVPFTFEGRAYLRLGNTTRRMSQERYGELLLERAHARRRWENLPAVDTGIEALDQEEILRTREAAVQNRRISAATALDAGDVLDRLGLRRGGVIVQAAQVLYGMRFLPDYPQGLLKLGRFRGSSVTGDILDNRQEHMHAFAAVREAMSFLERQLPLGAHFTEGRIFREDRLLLPPEALREIILNAVMHRDYSDPGGYVAVAVFDDRVEIRSVGRLPKGVTVEMLSGPHLSRLRNPLIADAFHRMGAVEIWGRGTNRVIDECRRYGVEPPTFSEEAGSLIVTFKAPIAPSPGAKSAPSRHQVGTKSELSQQLLLILQYCSAAQTITELMGLCGRKDRTKFRNRAIRPLLDAGLLEMTIPDKPRSSLQRYRTAPAGMELLKEKGIK